MVSIETKEETVNTMADDHSSRLDRCHGTEDEKWVFVTKLSRLVKNGKIRYLHSHLIKEYNLS